MDGWRQETLNMSNRRALKASEAIREVVSTSILIELRDPRIKNVTVTYVEVSPDLRSARVNVSVMGDEQKQKLALRGLQNSAGFLQRKIADRIDTRYTPKLTFRLDRGIKNALEISRILEEVLPEKENEHQQEAANTDDPSQNRDRSADQRPIANEQTLSDN